MNTYTEYIVAIEPWASPHQEPIIHSVFMLLHPAFRGATLSILLFKAANEIERTACSDSTDVVYSENSLYGCTPPHTPAGGLSVIWSCPN